MEDDGLARRREMMANLAKRFAHVRGQMTDAEFARMLADMVKVSERFTAIDAAPGAIRPDMSVDEIQRLLAEPSG